VLSQHWSSCQSISFSLPFRHLELEEIEGMLSKPETVMIALVDWNLMDCLDCGRSVTSVSHLPVDSYTGQQYTSHVPFLRQ